MIRDFSMMHRIAKALIVDRLHVSDDDARTPNSEELLDARAAVQAMREPNAAMIGAARAALNDPSIRTFEAAAMRAWTTMIDSVLAEAVTAADPSHEMFGAIR